MFLFRSAADRTWVRLNLIGFWLHFWCVGLQLYPGSLGLFGPICAFFFFRWGPLRTPKFLDGEATSAWLILQPPGSEFQGLSRQRR